MEHTKTKYTSDISDVDNMDGFEFEAFCCELLKQNGYTNVRKTQASGDYGLDVIATTKDGFICGIQCKNYQGTVGIAAIQEAKTGSDYYNCDIAIVLTNSTFTKQAVEIAQRTNVKLWDRKKLGELIKVFPEKVIEQEETPNDTIKIINTDKVDFGKAHITNSQKKYTSDEEIAETIKDLSEYYDTLQETKDNGDNDMNNVVPNNDKGWIGGCVIGIVLLIIIGICLWKFLDWLVLVIAGGLILGGLIVSKSK